MIEGLSHLTFIVRDLDKMETVLTTVLDAQKIYDSGAETFSLSQERFLKVGGLWVAVMQGAPLQEKTYNHVAHGQCAKCAGYEECRATIVGWVSSASFVELYGTAEGQTIVCFAGHAECHFNVSVELSVGCVCCTSSSASVHQTDFSVTGNCDVCGSSASECDDCGRCKENFFHSFPSCVFQN